MVNDVSMVNADKVDFLAVGATRSLAPGRGLNKIFILNNCSEDQ